MPSDRRQPRAVRAVVRRRDLLARGLVAAFDTRAAVSDLSPSAALRPPSCASRASCSDLAPGHSPVVGGRPRPGGLQGVTVQDTTQLGGALMRKLVGLFAGAAILVAACGGTSTTPAPATPAPPRRRRRRRRRHPARPRTRRRPRRPARSTCSARPTRPTARRRPAARSSSATGRKPPSSTRTTYGQVTEANVASLVWHTPADDQQRLQVHPAARGRADPDDRQRWRHGPRRERRRDDRHLEAPRRPQVVRRRAPHLRRLQVRVGVGHRPGQHRRRHRRLRRHHRDSTARRTRTWSGTSARSSRAT